MAISNRELFLLNNAQTSASPRLLEISRAEGVYLYDTKGKAYIDLVSGFAVSNIGHRHPAVLSAIRDQLDDYLHLTVYGEYVQSPQVKFASKLASVLPECLRSVYFVNSGAEAAEGAMKLAKRVTGRAEIISCHGAYHGSTQGALSAMGNEYYKQAYRPLLPGIGFITFGDENELERITTHTAGVIVETVQGEAGIRVPSVAYLQALREKCNQTGALLILDEIQTGFGRTGSLFAFEQFSVIPDILLLAKGMGGGMPVGAFISSQELMRTLAVNPILGHITTFGGHPVCCAAGLATLTTILKSAWISEVPAKEALFRQFLVHPLIREVRGMGLMLAVQLGSFEQVERTSKLAQEKGLIVDWFLHCETALRISPPLTISKAEIEKACRILLSALDET
jgi:acetylornithine/succinyldiaminopimelate/putrescine aminotransferase